MKISIQTFDGHLGIGEFLDWIAYVETFFEYMVMREKKRVILVV